MCASTREPPDREEGLARRAVPPRGKRLKKCSGPIIALAAILAYGQTAFYEFSYLDDHRLVVNNREFLGNIRNVGRVWTEDAFRVDPTSDAYYRPVFVLSFMLDVLAGGGRPQICHATNVVLHALACWLLYRVLLCLGSGPGVSLSVALLFCLHPVNVQAVAWIPGRNDILLSVFAMGAILTLRHYFTASGARRMAAYVGHISCFAAALFSKESAPMMLPFLCLLAVYWALQKLAVHEETTRRPSVLNALRQAFLLEWGICLLVWFALRHAALGAPGITARMSWSAVWEGLAGIVVLFGKTVLPVDLAILPEVNGAHIAYGCVVLLTCVAVVVVHARRSRRTTTILLGGLAWGFALLLPPLLMATGMTADVRFMEHRLYAPLIGFAVFWAHSGMLHSSGRAQANSAATAHWLTYTAVAVYFAVSAIHGSTHFKDRRTLAAAVLRQSPGSILAHTNMGVIHHLDGNLKDALRHYHTARDLDPRHPLPHLNLGILLIKEALPQEALPHLERASKLAPTWYLPHEYLAQALLALSRTNEAARAAHTAQELCPRGLLGTPPEVY